MYQTDLKLQDAAQVFNPVQATELALRGAEQLYDINVSTARVFVQAQANTAAAFGLPDFSPLFDLATDQTRQIWSTGAERVLDAAQRAADAATALQRNAGQLLETQATQAAQQLQRGVNGFNAQAVDQINQFTATMARPDMPLSPISEAAHALD